MSKKAQIFRENPAMAKLDMLVNGIKPPTTLALKDGEAPERYIYDSSVDTDLTLPSEIILPQKIISNIFLSPRSPWSLKERKLFYDAEEIFEIKFTPEANFTKQVLSDGTPSSRIAVMYGLDVFAVFVNRHCAYFKDNNGCHFCSIEYTRTHKGKNNVRGFSINQLVETFLLARNLDDGFFRHVMVTSGAYADPDKGILSQMKIIDAMKTADEDRRFDYHLVTIPPKSEGLLAFLAEEGPDTISFDIEVFDPDLFRKYCPGKEKQIGYDLFLKIFENASKLFPPSAVKAGFVCGIESVDTLVEGMEFFGKLGIHSALNIFHPDEGTELSCFPRPSKGYMLEVLREQARINRKYSLVPIFPELGRRSSLDTEVYRGFFDGI